MLYTVALSHLKKLNRAAIPANKSKSKLLLKEKALKTSQLLSIQAARNM